MSVNLASPLRPVSHVTGEQAVLALRRELPPSWIVREMALDYGIDCEIEIVEPGGTVTGAIVKAQVKGIGDGIAKGADWVSVRIASVRYWLSLPVPVILVHVDVGSEIVWWVDVHDYLLEQDQLETIYLTKKKTIRFKFEGANRLPDSIDKLVTLAREHQEQVRELRAEAVAQLKADFVGYCALVELFDADPDKYIGWLREKGSLEQLLYDLPFVAWVKQQAEEDPTFLARIRDLVSAVLGRTAT
jgi:hypothetical protein